MNSSPVPFNPGSPDTVSGQRSRAERVLAAYQQAVGHDLPNRLVVLQGLARMLEQSAAERLEPEERASLIRLADLARDAHGFVASLAEVGRACLRIETRQATSLVEICREAAAETGWLYPDRDLTYDIANSLPTLLLPPEGVRRVFVELFRQAARRATPGQPLRLTVEARSGPDGLEVLVRDDGPHLSAEQRRQVSDPFAAPTGEGPSFGLFLASLLAEGWGGSLAAGDPASEERSLRRDEQGGVAAHAAEAGLAGETLWVIRFPQRRDEG
jgi:two-component system, NtrC family, nitrogen regulation sensor histidine kinase NtrY